MSTDIAGVYALVKNVVDTFCNFQCLIALKNLVSCFLSIFNVDVFPVFVLIFPMLCEQKEKNR